MRRSYRPLPVSYTHLDVYKRQVMEMANKALSIYVYAVVGFGICMVQQGAFIGLGRTKIPLVAGILRIWLFRYLFILCTESFLGVYSGEGVRHSRHQYGGTKNNSSLHNKYMIHF